MRIVIRFILLIALIFCFSCEKGGFFVNCADCIETEPLKTELKIKFDGGTYPYVTKISVYEGNLEDSVLYTTMEIAGTSTTITTILNKKYTATATYLKSDIEYVTVDSATPRVAYNKDSCDKPCYYVYDNVIDLRLRYVK
jgi:hypothetical protein